MFNWLKRLRLMMINSRREMLTYSCEDCAVERRRWQDHNAECPACKAFWDSLMGPRLNTPW